MTNSVAHTAASQGLPLDGASSGVRRGASSEPVTPAFAGKLQSSSCGSRARMPNPPTGMSALRSITTSRLHGFH